MLEHRRSGVSIFAAVAAVVVWLAAARPMAHADPATSPEAQTMTLFGEMHRKMVKAGYREEAALLKNMLRDARTDGLARHSTFDRALGLGSRTGRVVAYDGPLPAEGSQVEPSTALRVSRVGGKRSQRYSALLSLYNGQGLELAMNAHKLKVRAIIPGRIGFGSGNNTMVRRQYERARPPRRQVGRRRR